MICFALRVRGVPESIPGTALVALHTYQVTPHTCRGPGPCKVTPCGSMLGVDIRIQNIRNVGLHPVGCPPRMHAPCRLRRLWWPGVALAGRRGAAPWCHLIGCDGILCQHITGHNSRHGDVHIRTCKDMHKYMLARRCTGNSLQCDLNPRPHAY